MYKNLKDYIQTCDVNGLLKNGFILFPVNSDYENFFYRNYQDFLKNFCDYDCVTSYVETFQGVHNIPLIFFKFEK